MANVQTTNNLVGEEHNKRVSFGGNEQVKMIVYDDGLIDDYTMNHTTKRNAAFTTPNAPQIKVTVTSENKEVPRPISPPARVEDVNPVVVTTSPMLPSLVKRMESEGVENPFRPEETLYHEVDPIVAAYRTRPFPPSPGNSPVHPHSTHEGSNSTAQSLSTSGHHWFSRSSKERQQNTSERSATTFAANESLAKDGANDVSQEIFEPASKKSSKSKRGFIGVQRQASLSEGRTDQRRSLTPPGNTSTADKKLPPPNKAEVVHIEEKKKRCGCCSLQ